ncbi:uncharacterized protein BT62DRAFT_936494, partial [Guyanagaster necrorhizus]
VQSDGAHRPRTPNQHRKATSSPGYPTSLSRWARSSTQRTSSLHEGMQIEENAPGIQARV